MSLNTLNIKQKQGGRVIKQADRSSTFKFALQDSNGTLINLNGQTANISLYNPNSKRYWETTAKVTDTDVQFKLPGNLKEDDYILEIACNGYVFPSDNDFIIEVVKGYKDLPDLKTAESYKKSIEEITQDYINQSDKKLKDNLASIDNTKKQIDENIENGVKNIKNTSNEYISLIGKKKDQALNEIGSSVKTETDKYLENHNKEINEKIDEAPISIEVQSDGTITTEYNDGRSSTAFGIKNALNGKVDKVVGKDLSDNNYTNQDKAKVDSIKNPWEIIHFGNFCKDKFGTETMDDTVDNWLKISSGYYYVRPDNIKNQPSNYGLMRLINIGSIDVIWETMNIGPVYRKSGDKSGISEWKVISQ